MSRLRLVCYDLSNVQRNGTTVMHVFRELGEHVQIYPGCVMVLSDLSCRDLTEKVSEALRDNDRIVIVEGEQSVIGGLTELQEKRLDELYDKAFPRQGVSRLKGAVPLPQREVSIEEMNDAIEREGSGTE